MSRTLSWWCFNPGIAMEDFSRKGAGSIILTSGTLSPMDSFAQELKLDFPIRIENPHVVSSYQIWVGVIPAGPSGYSLKSSFRTRDSPEYKQDLGNAIVNFSRIVPDGLLVFFASYYLMENSINYWKDNVHINSATSSTIWERMCKHKLPVVEPWQSSLFPASIEDYMSKLNDRSTSGPIFFAVCRGKELELKKKVEEEVKEKEIVAAREKAEFVESDKNASNRPTEGQSKNEMDALVNLRWALN